jgi:hypothetical protein
VCECVCARTRVRACLCAHLCVIHITINGSIKKIPSCKFNTHSPRKVSPVLNGTRQPITLSVTRQPRNAVPSHTTQASFLHCILLQFISIYSKESTTWVFQLIIKHSLADHVALFTDIFGRSTGAYYEEPPTNSIYFWHLLFYYKTGKQILEKADTLLPLPKRQGAKPSYARDCMNSEARESN